MNTIHKYILATTETTTIDLPADAELLSIQMKEGNMCMWVRLDTDKPKVPRTIRKVHTGDELYDNKLDHIDSVVVNRKVYHFFEWL